MDESRYGIPRIDPVPLPTAEHQQKITRQKWFEIITVILLILAGTGFLAWRNNHTHTHLDANSTITESGEALESAGFEAEGTTSILNRQFATFHEKLDIFDCRIDLVGTGPDAPMETAIVWLTPIAGTWSPTAESLQAAVNRVGELGQTLVQTSGEALVTATSTLSSIRDVKRPHERGVAATSDGWKVTYVTYQGFDENASPEPVLVLILQKLSAGSDSELADFNRTLYQAVDDGMDIKTALKAIEGVAPST